MRNETKREQYAAPEIQVIRLTPEIDVLVTSLDPNEAEKVYNEDE